MISWRGPSCACNLNESNFEGGHERKTCTCTEGIEMVKEVEVLTRSELNNSRTMNLPDDSVRNK